MTPVAVLISAIELPSPNQTWPSGPGVRPCETVPEVANSVICPVAGSTLPIVLAMKPISVNQIEPSAAVTIPAGRLLALARGYSWKVAVTGLNEPILPAASSVNQSVPSRPEVIATGSLLGVGVGAWAEVCSVGLNRPISPVCGTVNQSLPSAPAVRPPRVNAAPAGTSYCAATPVDGFSVPMTGTLPSVPPVRDPVYQRAAPRVVIAESGPSSVGTGDSAIETAISRRDSSPSTPGRRPRPPTHRRVLRRSMSATP